MAPVSPTACAHSPPRASTPCSTSPAPLLPDLVKIAPDPGDVVTIADPTAHEYGARLSTAPDHATPETLVEAAALGASGAYVPHVEVTYPLDQIGAAHARAESGHARGKLVITF